MELRKLIVLTYKTITCFTLIIFCQKSLCENFALVIEPIADLVGNILDLEKNNKFQTYETLPLESKKGTNNCKRINQALFNETVEIIAEKDGQIHIKTFNTFYQNQNGQNQSTYWAKKNNFVLLDDLKKAGLDMSLIPEPIRYSSKNINLENKNIITLKLPFYDKITNKTYSAGTRFVKTGKKTKKHIKVFALTQNNAQETESDNQNLHNLKTPEFKTIEIPLELCAKNTKKSKLKREEFLEIIKSWANIKDGFIPYVWGGSSYTQICDKEKIFCDPELQVYTRPGFDYTPTPGLDCSGLVARAAQICNIPYFYKNTLTAKNNLTKIKNLQELKNGDLIIYSGHIIIVSDIENNKIIEARTNEYGCGRVHEVSLSEVFYNIKNYQDLFNARNLGQDLHNSSPMLERIDTGTSGDKQKILSFDFYNLIS